MRASQRLFLATLLIPTLTRCSDDTAISRDTRPPAIDVSPRDVSSKTEGVLDGAAHDQRQDAAKTVKYSGQHLDWKGKPLVGANVCLYDNGKKSSQCVQTDSSGAFTITVPANVESGLFFDIAGYEKAIAPFVLTQDFTRPPGGIYDDATAKTEYGKVGSTYPPVGKGHIAVTGPADATFAIYPSGGIGPHYANAAGLMDPTLTKMQFGWGMVLDLAPGTYEVACTKTGLTCTAPNAWPSKQYTARVPVVDGYFSQVDCTCK